MQTRVWFLVIVASELFAFAAAGRTVQAGTPEETLQSYINGVRHGDLAQVEACFEPRAESFYLPAPIPVSTYTIRERITYGSAKVHDWNSKGIVPAARIGDVELQVEETIRGAPQMYSYLFRKFDDSWKIIAHAAWGVD